MKPTINPDSIPAELRQLHQWVVWRRASRGGKITKVPFRADRPRIEADSTNPATWSSFHTAMTAYHDGRTECDGVGFVFAADGGIVGLDLDRCLDDAGNVLPWAAPLLDRLPSYAEISPSGIGIKIFLRGAVPDGKGRKRTKLGADGTGAIECYNRNRYFTITGNVWRNSPIAIVDLAAELNELHRELFPPDPKPSAAAPPPRSAADDQALLARMFASANGDKIRRLFEGDTSGHGSGSEADMALANHLAWWTDGDEPSIDRLFRQSKLCDDKWRQRPDYRATTIARAVEGLDRRPRIILSPDMQKAADEASAAIAADERVFKRGNTLVRIAAASRPLGCKKSARRPAGSLRILAIPPPIIRELIASNARIMAYKTSRSDAPKLVPALPPEWLVHAVAARTEWPTVRHLEGVVESPTLRPDGSIVDAPGYDPATGLLYAPNGEFPRVPANPDFDDAERAVSRLLNLVGDFPFADYRTAEADKTDDANKLAWLAAFLTVLARSAIEGPTPMFLINANTSGAGKGKLLDIIAVAATGRPMPCTGYPHNDEEMSKTLLAIALGGDRVVSFDNIATGWSVGSSSLDSAVTSNTFKGRILGRSEMSVELPMTSIIFVNGNNIGTTSDALRRIVPVRLESAEVHPEQRADFKIPDILHHVAEHRGELVRDGLTILRAFVVAGRPDQSLDPMDFPAWSGLVRAAIKWAWGADPCKGRLELVATDAESVEHEALVRGWSDLVEQQSTDALSAKEALDVLHESPARHPPLVSIMSGWTEDGELPSPLSLGKHLGKLKGKMTEQGSLQSAVTAGCTRWYVKKPPPKPPPK